MDIKKYVLFLVLLTGACFDLWRRKIPNWWVVTAAAAGMALAMEQGAAAAGYAEAFIRAVCFCARMTAVILIFFPLFLCRMMGAADVKLMALVYAYAESPAGLHILGCAFCVGAVWSLGKMAVHRSFFTRLVHFIAYFRRIFHTGRITAYREDGTEAELADSSIPFGVCLFLGMAAFLLMK